MGRASKPQNTLSSTQNVGTPNTPRAMASSVLALSCAFTSGSSTERWGASCWVKVCTRAASSAAAPPCQPTVYYFRALGASSAKYGPCEVCGQHVAEMWIRSDGREQAFGHEACVRKAEKPIAMEDR